MPRGEVPLDALEEWRGCAARSSSQAGIAISIRQCGERNGFNVVTIDKDGVSIEFRDFNGVYFQSNRTIVYRRRDSAWEHTGLEVGL